MWKNKLVGRIELHNIKEQLSEIFILSVLGVSIARRANSTLLRQAYEHLQHNDSLTDAYNFEGFKKYATELIEENLMYAII